MTVSMRVMSAGDGYKYLLRTVAAGDGDRSLSTPLTRYYAEAGTPPGRTRQAPRLIAGLIPEAGGSMTPDIQQALAERRHLIETRAEAVLDTALHTQEPWVTALGPIPASGREQQQWRRCALVVAAYRDRYQITDPTPLGAQPESTAQKIDAARARAALNRAQSIANDDPSRGRMQPTTVTRSAPSL